MPVKRFRGRTPTDLAFGASRATRAGGFVFVGAVGATDEAGNLLHPGDAARQAEVALAALSDDLARVGVGMERVVRTTVYLVRASDGPDVAAVHARAFGARAPATTVVVVSGLGVTGMLVQVDAVAMLREPGEAEDEEPAGAYMRRATRRPAPPTGGP